ncbi:MAG: sulfotransferase domain-containing protein [Pseudomonadota bacterium]
MSDLQRIIWLASFPKSGNTWLRSFLATYFHPPGQAPDINTLRRFTTGDVRGDFYERASGRVPFTSPDLEDFLAVRQKAVRLIAASKAGLHFVKTHSPVRRTGRFVLVPPDLTAGALYIIRNPFDVAQSYRRHLGCTMDETIVAMANPNWINRTPAGVCEVIGRWDTHIESWTAAPGLMRHVIRYEDMIGDPEATFRALLGFLKAPVQDGQLRRAMRETSFETLKAEEAKKGFIERPQHMEAFFAKGQAGSWREALTPAQVAAINEAFRPTIEHWWPEMVEEIDAVVARA